MYHLLLIQALIILSSAIGFGFWRGDAAILPALYGGAIALGNTLLLFWGVYSLRRVAVQQQNLFPLYISGILRFVFTLLAMFAGMGALALLPLPLLVTFGLAYLGHALAAPRLAVADQ